MRIQRTAVTPPKVSQSDRDETESMPLVGVGGAAGKDIALNQGDRIEYAVTHEINADGEKAWIKYGVNTALADGETPEDATGRVVKFVNTVVIQAATEVASQIMQA